MRRSLWVLLFSLIVAMGIGCGWKKSGTGNGSKKTILTIFVPCGMILPFDSAKKAYEATHSGVQLAILYDTANVLINRIEKKGDRPDIFVAPGCQEINYLVEKKIVDVADKKAIGRYQLMMFVPKKSTVKIEKLEDLLSPDVKQIALADPEKNSVGYYVRQSLTKIGMWDKIKNKLIFTEHPIASYKLVARNKVHASFAYLKCPLESAPEKLKYSRVRIVAPLPPGTYDQPTVFAAVLSTSKQKKTAKEFIDFLASPEGQRILDAKGMPRYWNDDGTRIKEPLRPPKGLLRGLGASSGKNKPAAPEGKKRAELGKETNGGQRQK